MSSENRFPLFGIMVWARRPRSRGRMPTRLPKRTPAAPGRFRSFMASTPAWFQWAVLTAMFLAGLGIVVAYLYMVRTDPLDAGYYW
jgi:hypothetical protein